jgi:integrase
VKAMLAARQRSQPARPLTAARLRRVHTTLMSALNTAVKRRLLPLNPASYVELDTGRRPKAVVWTEQREAHWRATGERPKVAVWLPSQTGAFLDHAETHRLYALLHVIAFRGLRRGEAVGLRWTEVDLDQATLTVCRQILQLGAHLETGEPKSESGERTVALDAGTVDVLRLHRVRQLEERLQWGAAWIDTGLVFTAEDGSALVPDHVSRLFARLIKEADLPPVRLHDLRHGAASQREGRGANLKVVSEMLGHSTIAITADTYTSVLPEVAREAAEAAVRLVPRATSAGHRVPILSPSGDQGPRPRGSPVTKPQVSGGRGIRTHGTSHPVQRFSRPPPSASRRALLDIPQGARCRVPHAARALTPTCWRGRGPGACGRSMFLPRGGSSVQSGGPLTHGGRTARVDEHVHEPAAIVHRPPEHRAGRPVQIVVPVQYWADVSKAKAVVRVGASRLRR